MTFNNIILERIIVDVSKEIIKKVKQFMDHINK